MNNKQISKKLLKGVSLSMAAIVAAPSVEMVAYASEEQVEAGVSEEAVASNEELSEAVDNATAEVENTTNTIEETDSAVDEIVEDTSDVEKRVEVIDADAKAIEAAANEADAATTEEAANEAITSVEQKIEEMDSNVTAAEIELKATEDKLFDAWDKVDEAAAALSIAEADKNTTAAELEKAKKAFEDARKEAADLKAEVDEALEAVKAEKLSVIATLQEELLEIADKNSKKYQTKVTMLGDEIVKYIALNDDGADIKELTEGDTVSYISDYVWNKERNSYEPVYTTKSLSQLFGDVSRVYVSEDSEGNKVYRYFLYTTDEAGNISVDEVKSEITADGVAVTKDDAIVTKYINDKGEILGNEKTEGSIVVVDDIAIVLDEKYNIPSTNLISRKLVTDTSDSNNVLKTRIENYDDENTTYKKIEGTEKNFFSHEENHIIEKTTADFEKREVKKEIVGAPIRTDLEPTAYELAVKESEMTSWMLNNILQNMLKDRGIKEEDLGKEIVKGNTIVKYEVIREEPEIEIDSILGIDGCCRSTGGAVYLKTTTTITTIENKVASVTKYKATEYNKIDEKQISANTDQIIVSKVANYYAPTEENILMNALQLQKLADASRKSADVTAALEDVTKAAEEVASIEKKLAILSEKSEAANSEMIALEKKLAEAQKKYDDVYTDYIDAVRAADEAKQALADASENLSRFFTGLGKSGSGDDNSGKGNKSGNRNSSGDSGNSNIGSRNSISSSGNNNSSFGSPIDTNTNINSSLDSPIDTNTNNNSSFGSPIDTNIAMKDTKLMNVTGVQASNDEITREQTICDEKTPKQFEKSQNMDKQVSEIVDEDVPVVAEDKQIPWWVNFLVALGFALGAVYFGMKKKKQSEDEEYF